MTTSSSPARRKRKAAATTLIHHSYTGRTKSIFPAVNDCFVVLKWHDMACIQLAGRLAGGSPTTALRNPNKIYSYTQVRLYGRMYDLHSFVLGNSTVSLLPVSLNDYELLMLGQESSLHH